MGQALKEAMQELQALINTVWNERAHYRKTKKRLREHVNYPKEGTAEEAAFLNGAYHMLGVVQQRARAVRVDYEPEVAETKNTQALNAEVIAVRELIAAFNEKWGKK